MTGEQMSVKENWELPSPPKGFSQACVFYYPDGEFILDWTRAKCDFASEYDIESNIEYPFTDKKPKSDNDWVEINIVPIRA